jgi:2-hydroxychromene-2-carboxylate isomerase
MAQRSDERIDFYFDHISPNAYLVWHVLPGLADKYGFELEPVPVLFAGFLKAFGQLGPAEIVPKFRWMNRNNLRKARILGIPLNPPKMHPYNPLFLLRLNAQPLAHDTRMQLTGVLLSAVWVDAIDPNDANAVSAYLDAQGLDGRALVEGASGDTAKAAVRANTDACIARGGFGVPTMIVGDEIFWGYDDLPYLEHLLADEDPLAGIDIDAVERAWSVCRAAGQHRGRG